MNQVVFITGSSGALGTAVADLFTNRGWTVAGFDRTGSVEGSDSHRFAIDATNDGSLTDAFAAAVKKVGVPRAVISTVGGIKPAAPIEETALADFDFLLRLNVSSAFLACREAMRWMKPEGIGSIITIGAESGLVPEAKKAGYVASKAGVIALTRVVAEEGKAVGINANCLVPILLRTKANEEWGNAAEIPTWTDVRDVGELCFFLSSDAGRAINGATIRIPNRV